MSDLHTVLPSYMPPSPTAASLLSSLEAAAITTTDLLTQDALTLARRLGSTTRSSVLDIKLFVLDIATALHADTTPPIPQFLTTGDAKLDEVLGGGIRTCCITEFVGESGAGKSQFLLPLLLTSQLPTSSGGLGKNAVYISTEAPLCTPRLAQIAAVLDNPLISMENVHTITCADLETQEHILTYQLPILVERANVGVVVLDSVAANFRDGDGGGGPAGRAKRGGEIVRMANRLRAIARRGVAVVVANQVADSFLVAGERGDEDALELDVQARWFNGWEGEEEVGGDAKVPSLGMVWAVIVAVRVVLKREEVGGGWRRSLGVVFAPWGEGGECVFEVWDGGVRAFGGRGEVR